MLISHNPMFYEYLLLFFLVPILSDPDYCTPKTHFEDDFWLKLEDHMQTKSPVPVALTSKPPTPSS